MNHLFIGDDSSRTHFPRYITMTIKLLFLHSDGGLLLNVLNRLHKPETFIPFSLSPNHTTMHLLPREEARLLLHQVWIYSTPSNYSYIISLSIGWFSRPETSRSWSPSQSNRGYRPNRLPAPGTHKRWPTLRRRTHAPRQGHSWPKTCPPKCPRSLARNPSRRNLPRWVNTCFNIFILFLHIYSVFSL